MLPSQTPFAKARARTLQRSTDVPRPESYWAWLMVSPRRMHMTNSSICTFSHVSSGWAHLYQDCVQTVVLSSDIWTCGAEDRHGHFSSSLLHLAPICTRLVQTDTCQLWFLPGGTTHLGRPVLTMLRPCNAPHATITIVISRCEVGIPPRDTDEFVSPQTHLSSCTMQ